MGVGGWGRGRQVQENVGTLGSLLGLPQGAWPGCGVGRNGVGEGFRESEGTAGP